MKFLVIGAGMMGSAVAYDLAHSSDVEHVLLADIDGRRASEVARDLGSRVEPLTLDTGSIRDVVKTMRRVDAAIGATSYRHNLALTGAAIEAGIHFCDLGGNMDVVYSQMALDEAAKKAGVIVMPNCGLAPGLGCIIAALAAQRMDSVDEIHIRVGGLPQRPEPPLNYALVFSVQGLINEYLEPAEVIRDGKKQTVPSMADLEALEFPAPFGMLEAFNTSGGVSVLPAMFENKIRTLDYKTIRYPGHCEKFKTLLDLGFAGAEPIMVGSNVLTAREIFEALLKKKLPSGGPDLVLMRVTVRGRVGDNTRTLAYEMVDYYDTTAKLSAMARTTSFPTSIIAQMAVKGAIRARGVKPPESAMLDVPLESLLNELSNRNIRLAQSEMKR